MLSRSPAVAGAAACLALLAAPAHAAPTVERHTAITGVSASSAGAIGDLNGDGRDDVFVGGCGSATVVFGAVAKATVSVTAPGDRGIRLTNLPGCAESYANLGDVNGDGRDDLGMHVSGPFQSTARELHVIFGRATATTVDVRSLGTAGYVLVEPGNAGGGGSIARVGDVNGDGLADIGFVGTVADPGAQSGSVDVTGVVFGRRGTPGDLVLTSSFDGLRLRDGSTPWGGVGQIGPLGDVNGDGRDDVIARPAGSFGSAAVVYGRATAASLDTSDLGDAGQRVGDVAPGTDLGDVNGDGLRDHVLGSGIGLSSRSGAVFSSSRTLTLTASAGGFTLPEYARAAGDLTGDGRGDLTTTVAYGQLRGSYLTGWPASLTLNYAVAGVAAPRTVDLRVPGDAAVRIDALPDGAYVKGGLRFAGYGGQLLAEESRAGTVTVYDVVDRPVVADRTPPTLSGVSISTPYLVSSLPFGPSSAVMRFTVSERAYMELEVRRSGSLVTWSRGSVAPGADSWTIGVAGPSRLPRGRYTATIKATDLSGNAAPVRTLTFQVL